MVSDKLRNSETTNSEELTNIGKFMFKEKFKGVFSSDNIPDLNNNESCIINTDPQYKNGMHWCSLFKFKNNTYFYDSYSRNFKLLSKYWKNKQWINIKSKNNFPEESLYDNNCGQLSLAALYLFYKYKGPYVISLI